MPQMRESHCVFQLTCIEAARIQVRSGGRLIDWQSENQIAFVKRRQVAFEAALSLSLSLATDRCACRANAKRLNGWMQRRCRHSQEMTGSGTMQIQMSQSGS